MIAAMTATKIPTAQDFSTNATAVDVKNSRLTAAENTVAKSESRRGASGRWKACGVGGSTGFGAADSAAGLVAKAVPPGPRDPQPGVRAGEISDACEPTICSGAIRFCMARAFATDVSSLLPGTGARPASGCSARPAPWLGKRERPTRLPPQADSFSSA